MEHIQKISNYQEYIWYLSDMKAVGEVNGTMKELSPDTTHKIGEKRKFDLEGIRNGKKKILFKTFQVNILRKEDNE
jgi:hypothetical protein